MRATVVAGWALAAALTAAICPAQDGAPKHAVPRWSGDGFTSLAVSRDGSWLAARATLKERGFHLFPTDGGEPIRLDLGSDDAGGLRCEFSADSKWLVVPGSDVPLDVGKGRSQAIFVFPTASPFKRRAYQNKLEVGGIVAERTGLDLLQGNVSEPYPLTGSRMLFGRGSGHDQVWDVATGAKTAAPVGLEDRWKCGVSADGVRAVRCVDTGIEIRDLKANRVLKTIAIAGREKTDMLSHPTLSPSGAEVVFLWGKMALRGPGQGDFEYMLQCWSTADGTRSWSVPVGRANLVTHLDVTAKHVVVTLAGTARVFDLRDGTKSEVGDGRPMSLARATADGNALWVVMRDARAHADVLTRVELPAATPK